MINAFNRRDAELVVTKSLPASATNVVSPAIDLQNGPAGHFLAPIELEIVAPALATGLLPDTKTATYDLIMSENSDLSSPTTIQAGVIVQTGAGGAGDGAETKRVRLPVDVDRYVGLKCTTTGSVDASSASMTLSVLV